MIYRQMSLLLLATEYRIYIITIVSYTICRLRCSFTITLRFIAASLYRWVYFRLTFHYTEQLHYMIDYADTTYDEFRLMPSRWCRILNSLMPIDAWYYHFIFDRVMPHATIDYYYVSFPPQLSLAYFVIKPQQLFFHHLRLVDESITLRFAFDFFFDTFGFSFFDDEGIWMPASVLRREPKPAILADYFVHCWLADISIFFSG